MGWAFCGHDDQGREIGYSVRAKCDHPGCAADIDRGLGHVCGGMHGGDGDSQNGCDASLMDSCAAGCLLRGLLLAAVMNMTGFLVCMMAFFALERCVNWARRAGKRHAEMWIKRKDGGA